MTASVPFAEIAPSRGDIGDTDELSHYYCCDLNLALCGADITDLTEALPDGRVPAMLCVVCKLLTSCNVCGREMR